MVDGADHVTGKTGVSITDAAITISKNGGAFATRGATTATPTERANGWYAVSLGTDDTDTLGDLVLHVTGTGCDPADRLLTVYTADLTDLEQIHSDTTSAAGDAAIIKAAVQSATYGLAIIKAQLDGMASYAGTGDTAVNHNTGGIDQLRYEYNGVGVDNATIVAYLKADYQAGNTGSGSARGSSTTGPDGRWLNPIFLDAGFTYIICFYVQDTYGVTPVEVAL